VSIQGAYLCLNSRPRLQSELRVQIDSNGESPRPVPISLRANVVHFEESADKNQVGVGVVFVEEPEARRNRD
jgi:hypothetical protein